MVCKLAPEASTHMPFSYFFSLPPRLESWVFSCLLIENGHLCSRKKRQEGKGISKMRGSSVVIGEICPLGCWEFQTGELWYIFSSCTYQHKSVAGHFSFPKGRRLLERDLIQFSKERACTMHSPYTLKQEEHTITVPPPPPRRKNTHKSYIIIPGKTPLTQDCSFFLSASEPSELG